MRHIAITRCRYQQRDTPLRHAAAAHTPFIAIVTIFYERHIILPLLPSC